MGEIADGLYHPLILGAAHFVQQNCKNDGQGKADDNLQERNTDGIDDSGEQSNIAEKLLEPFEPGISPGAAPDALFEFIFLEGDLQTGDRNKLDKDHVENRWKQEHKQVTLSPQLPAEELPALALGTIDDFCRCGH